MSIKLDTIKMVSPPGQCITLKIKAISKYMIVAAHEMYNAFFMLFTTATGLYVIM